MVAASTLALLAAACGGGGAPGVATVTTSTLAHPPTAAATTTTLTHELLAAGRCLREHGLPNLPDPTIASSGPAQGHAVLDKLLLLHVPQSVVSNAISACHTSLAQADFYNAPNSGTSPQEIQNLLAFSRCVRNHGITDFPDPDSDGNFNLSGTGINSHQLTPAQVAVARICLPTAHGAVHIPAQGKTTTSPSP